MFWLCKKTEIAQLFKHKCTIELYFKWMKFHLKIKSVGRHLVNAVKIQVWTVVTVICFGSHCKEEI